MHDHHLQETVALAFHPGRVKGVLQQGGDHHQHHQREHDAQQVYGSEQLAAHEDFPCG
ncbi:hypothetical protein LP420_33800 [Massilia sp. B-10]|nr:hypothetical protein LP420_33800 [Massilia sp. B-10]